MSKSDDKDDERQAPCDEEAERSVLGATLLYASDVLPIVGDLAVDDFMLPHHREAWAAIIALQKRRMPIDVISVGDELKASGMHLRFPLPWQQWAVEVSSSITLWRHAGNHADVIRAKSTLRKLIALGAEVANLAYSNQPADEVLARAREGVASLEVSGGGKGPEKVGTLLGDVLDAIEARCRGVATVGIPSSVRALGKIITAYKPGRMYIIAGRPGDGKSALAGQEALFSSLSGYPAIFFSREMINAELVERDLSIESKVPAYAIGGGKLEYSEWKKIQNAGGKISEAPLWMDDRSATIERIVAETRKWHALNVRTRKDGLGLMVLDYLQLARLAKARSQSNREQVVAEMSRMLKETAQELQIPVVVLSQLSRKAEERGGRPILSDLRESGAIEQDADVVLFVYRDIPIEDQAKRRLSGPAEIICGKHRGGPTGIAHAHFTTELMHFEDLADDSDAQDARPNWQDSNERDDR